MKIGFIGTGNIAYALIKGITASDGTGAVIYAYDKDEQKLLEFKNEFGVTALSSNTDVIKESDVVFLAIKPHIYAPILKELKEVILEEKPVIVSIAAGTALQDIKNNLDGSEIPIIRIMPNVNSAVGAGMTALCKNDVTTAETFKEVQDLLELTGRTVVLPEEQFAIFSGIAGCSPAFTYLFIEALAKAALKNGIPKEQALLIASQAVMGSGKNILSTGLHPGQMVDKVTSPGGTTIAGVCTLEHEGFSSSVIKAVEATLNRDHEISRSK